MRECQLSELAQLVAFLICYLKIPVGGFARLDYALPQRNQCSCSNICIETPADLKPRYQNKDRSMVRRYSRPLKQFPRSIESAYLGDYSTCQIPGEI